MRTVFLPDVWLWCSTSVDEAYRTGRQEARQYYFRVVRRLLERRQLCPVFAKEDWEIGVLSKQVVAEAAAVA